MENKKVLISIIMPVYNSENYLKSCVNSILSQNFTSFELLLIDDGSTDKSPALCDEIALSDARVKVFHKENGGICEARNFGLKKAVGEYIAFSDHDDIVLPGFLSDNYKVAKENNADIVKFGRKALYLDGETLKRTDVRQYEFRVLSGDNIRKSYLQLRMDNTMTCVWDGIYKKEFLEKNSLDFDIRYKKGGEDIDFCGKCFSFAKSLVFNSSIYYELYIRKGFSTSTKKDDDKTKKLQMLICNLEYCCKTLGISAKNPGYKMCVMKELVYPTFLYLVSQDVGKCELYRMMDDIHSKYFTDSDRLISLMKRNKKWGFITWIFELRHYWILYKICKKRSF